MDFARQLKSQINIAEVIGAEVPLKRLGSTARYTGRCPFHNEKTPSFHVHADHQFYYCFGCQAKGDVFTFLMQRHGLTFYEAMQTLAERYGIPMPQRSENSDRESRLRDAIYRMNEIALRHFRAVLTGAAGAEARQYLAGRGVDARVAEQFGIGLSDRSGALLQQLQREGFSAELLEASGLVLRRQDGSGFFERFRGRLMFTIHNESGKIAGFAGRAMVKGEEPKYMNSPETQVYSKKTLLYNLHRAREAARERNRFILVEGYMDVIGLAMAGIGEGVASCGTALSPEQVRLMKRFAQQVVVNFDPDAGGQRGAERSIQLLLDEHLRVRVLELSGDLDPDEFLQQQGAPAYLALAERAPNYYFWLADQARKRFDSRTAEGRTDALKFLLPVVQRIPDKIERASVAGDLASYLGVDRGLILDQFKKAALDRREAALPARGAPLRNLEAILLRTLLRYPELRRDVFARLAGIGIIGNLQSGPILALMARLTEADPAFPYEELEARLEEKDRDLLSRVLFADEVGESDSVEAARANVDSCLQRLQGEDREAHVQALRQSIRAAEQSGDLTEALRLTMELDRWRRTASGASIG